MSGLKKEVIGTGETLGVVLTNVKTGQKRIIDQTPSPTQIEPPTQRIEVIVTDLRTGKKQRYEVTR